MSEAKFTPGPWAIDSTGSVVTANNRGYVAEAYDGKRSADTDPYIAAANARLIAAAPDLHENLARMVEHFETWASDHSMEATTETWSALHCARAALAKAGLVSAQARSLEDE